MNWGASTAVLRTVTAFSAAIVLGWFGLSMVGVSRAEQSRTPASSSTQDDSAGLHLVAELGCAACHPGLTVSSELVRSRAPSLSTAGRRYQPAYVYAYLMNPERVRKHIGASRMPSFALSERESLALTLYLASFTAMPDYSVTYPDELISRRVPRYREDEARSILRSDFGCTTCHALEGTGRDSTIALDNVGARIQTAWLVRYIATPQVFDTATDKPGVFERVDGNLHPRVEDSARKIKIAADYLVKRATDRRQELERAFARARRDHPDVDAASGAVLFAAFNCAGCHENDAVAPAVLGPDLSTVRRLQEDWLVSYLESPKPIRRFGFYPGSGTRMPNFGLTDTEARWIATTIRSIEPRIGLSDFVPQTLTAFDRDKALRLVRDRLACLGCHRLDGEGGQIGPDLSGVGVRLTPAAILEMLRNPQRLAPGSIMPHRPMPDDRIELIVSWLTTEVTEQRDSYMSPLDYEWVRPTGGTSGRELYNRFCVGCHGMQGHGDGFNAPFLPIKPTVHADSAYMSTRPDDTLFDGIHAGGYILGKSHRMPAFGQRLTSQEIRDLVAYIRVLCNCQGPAWSRDGKGAGDG